MFEQQIIYWRQNDCHKKTIDGLDFAELRRKE